MVARGDGRVWPEGPKEAGLSRGRLPISVDGGDPAGSNVPQFDAPENQKRRVLSTVRTCSYFDLPFSPCIRSVPDFILFYMSIKYLEPTRNESTVTFVLRFMFNFNWTWLRVEEIWCNQFRSPIVSLGHDSTRKRNKLLGNQRRYLPSLSMMSAETNQCYHLSLLRLLITFRVCHVVTWEKKNATVVLKFKMSRAAPVRVLSPRSYSSSPTSSSPTSPTSSSSGNWSFFFSLVRTPLTGLRQL